MAPGIATAYIAPNGGYISVCCDVLLPRSIKPTESLLKSLIDWITSRRATTIRVKKVDSEWRITLRREARSAPLASVENKCSDLHPRVPSGSVPGVCKSVDIRILQMSDGGTRGGRSC